MIRTAKKMPGRKVAVDFTMNDTFGDPVSLSSFKGKVLLIVFWRGMNKSSRMLNKSLVGIYERYRDMGFDILGVSCDSDHETWTKAIGEDKLTWAQVANLGNPGNPARRLYNIQSLPYTILLDQDLKIIGREIDYHDLESRVRQALGKTKGA